ncbi:MAG: hypothetical protein FGM57_03140 [Candidatus Taylorbacteria bacterium]|nr:hypothetical protein [Candidatus Taylorbacteria bacterium]
MSTDLRFEEEQIRPIRPNDSGAFVYNRYDPRQRIPPLVRFLMRSRIVRSETQARNVVIALCVLLLLSAVILLYRATDTPELIRLKLSI